MIVKQARNVQNGTAKGLVGYILGYALGGAKGEEQQASYQHLMSEAMSRDDFGVGTVFAPRVGEGIRPSSVLAYGLTSLGTADMEMTAVAKANPRAKTAVHHFILSFAGDAGITDETMHEATRRVLQKIGLGDHQVVQSVHRDTVTGIDPETGYQIGPVHVHVAAGAINPLTLLAWETRLSHKRIHKAAREVEIDMGLSHDRGLYVAREHSGQWRVEEATVSERKSWLREQVEHRRDDLTRKTADQYQDFESPASWCSVILAPKIRALLDSADDKGEDYLACDLHAKALAFGVELSVEQTTGQLIGRLRESIPDDEQTSAKLSGRDEHEDAPSRTARTRATNITVGIDIQDIIGPAPEKRDLLTPAGNNPYILTPKQRKFNAHILDEQKRYEKRVALISKLDTLEQSEESFARFVRANPTYISRQIVASGRSTFSRNEIDGFLAARITSPDVIEELSHFVEQNDDTITILSPDTANPLFATKEHLADLNKVAAMIKAFDRPDTSMPDSLIRDSIRAYEREQTARTGKPFALTVSQRMAMGNLGRTLSVVGGEAGSGKTSLMQVVGLVCKAQNRPMIGLATAQMAAERLLQEIGNDAIGADGNGPGFSSINTMRAKFNQAMDQIIKPKSVIIIDEAGMLGLSGLDYILSEAIRNKGCKILAIGDLAQLPSIDASSPMANLVAHAMKTGSYVELKEVQRHRGDLEWKRKNTRDMGVAIRDSNPEALKTAVVEMAKHGVFKPSESRTETIEQAVAWYLDNSKSYGVKNTLLLASDKDSVKHLNQRIRLAVIPADTERHNIRTRFGARNLAVGERIIFKKNQKRLGVTNGEHAVVRGFTFDGKGHRLRLVIERADGRTLHIDPVAYDQIEYGYATTVHNAQGASVKACGAVVDKSVLPTLLHVMASRASTVMALFYATSAFPDERAIADHVADRLSVVDDALLFSQQVERYGGPDSTWARRVRQAQERDADPLRIQHRREMAARKAKHDMALKTLHAQFKGRTSPTDAKAHKAGAKRISKEYAPESFVMWATKHNSEIVAEAAAAERMPQYRRERDLKRQQQQQRDLDLSQRQEQAVKQPQRALAPITRAPEIDRGSSIGW